MSRRAKKNVLRLMEQSRAISAEVADRARDLLTAADSGEVVGVAMVAQYRDGSFGIVFEGVNCAGMAGGVAMLQRRILEQWGE